MMPPHTPDLPGLCARRRARDVAFSEQPIMVAGHLSTPRKHDVTRLLCCTPGRSASRARGASAGQPMCARRWDVRAAAVRGQRPPRTGELQHAVEAARVLRVGIGQPGRALQVIGHLVLQLQPAQAAPRLREVAPASANRRRFHKKCPGTHV